MTIHDLAKLAGVSASTVSRVFSRHPNIRAEVREQVLALARKHGYHPRISDKQRNVVVITPYDSIFPVQSCVDMLLMALMQELPSHGFRIEILPVNNLERLDSIPFCAAVAIGCDPDEFSGWTERFPASLTVVDRAPGKTPLKDVYFVRSDEAQGMEAAIAHLASRGCSRIGCMIHGTPDSGNAFLRWKGIQKALRRHELPCGDRLIRYAGLDCGQYMELTGKLLKENVDALFCPGGNAGIVEMYVLNLFGKSVPEDISLIASEQTFFSRYGVPPQTTITQDYPAVAAAVAEVIEKRLGGSDVPLETILPYRLIERESVR